MQFLAILAATISLVAATPVADAQLSLPTGLLSSLGIKIPDMPQCAMPCAQTLYSKSGCSLNSGIVGCICKSPALTDMKNDCVPKSCTAAGDADKVSKVLTQYCPGS